ncbi:hypothetical protein SAICODRAFT_32128 [Saitoella complicata NRRL Y-17804]|uniref:uncharacterized protein n=1 Tax=Saitoella complicata (strain BCRC 22490 / CBS 7301 / JCM 7358 / NBRC 10748 / NRRL Y-17804) TaxID=698492 RepID=UPI0008677FDE|nr:uncharacterized protein SAICODRAFT_32128 [Saitoella complicata NRRL Y-17804]ODQ50202.1 hypothetical protein SAICODRAFT_32128 [Saitoella complicata NRRL Y-17804]
MAMRQMLSLRILTKGVRSVRRITAHNYTCRSPSAWSRFNSTSTSNTMYPDASPRISSSHGPQLFRSKAQVDSETKR